MRFEVWYKHYFTLKAMQASSTYLSIKYLCVSVLIYDYTYVCMSSEIYMDYVVVFQNEN